MAEIHSRSFEETRKAFFELEMQKAQNRIDFWRRKLEKAKYGTAQLECHKNASDAGWEYNFYKDALEALERVQQLEAQGPKWISVEERLPEEVMRDDSDVSSSDLVIVAVCDDMDNIFVADDIVCRGEWVNYPAPLFDVTHWMPLPEPPKEG